MEIAVIDDGISESLYDLGELSNNIEISQDFTVQKRTGYNPFASSHGTTCAAIIHKYAPGAALSSIRILNSDTRKSTKGQLITALRWCSGNRIRLVNLSLGTEVFRDFDEIRECVNEVAKWGIIIVAACSNSNKYTVPACLSNVIGVRCRRLYVDDIYSFSECAFDGIDIMASSRHYLTDTYGNARYTNPSNSFAAPLITAKVHNIMAEHPEYKMGEVREALFEGSHRKVSWGILQTPVNIDWIRNIAPADADSFKKLADIYGSYLEDHLERVQNIDVPVVAFYGCSGSVQVNILKVLCTIFQQQGYYTIGVSDFYECITCGLELKPPEIDTYRFLSNVYKKYGCDLILAGISGEAPSICDKPGNDPGMEDVRVVFSDDQKVYILSEEEPENVTVLTLESNTMCDKDICQLYERIMKLLE